MLFLLMMMGRTGRGLCLYPLALVLDQGPGPPPPQFWESSTCSVCRGRQQAEGANQQPGSWKLWLCFLSLLLCVWLDEQEDFSDLLSPLL